MSLLPSGQNRFLTSACPVFNMGISGLVFCLSAFANQITASASVYLALLTTLSYILAAITLGSLLSTTLGIFLLRQYGLI
jgi:hypothetical protein